MTHTWSMGPECSLFIPKTWWDTVWLLRCVIFVQFIHSVILPFFGNSVMILFVLYGGKTSSYQKRSYNNCELNMRSAFKSSLCKMSVPGALFVFSVSIANAIGMLFENVRIIKMLKICFRFVPNLFEISKRNPWRTRTPVWELSD